LFQKSTLFKGDNSMHNRLLALGVTLTGLTFLAPQIYAQSSTSGRFTVTIEGAPDGPAVLFLPGLASSRSVFDTEASLLAANYRLYRIQINGFAGQPAGLNAAGPILDPLVTDLHQYIVATHLHPAVIGHSLGGLLGLMLAASHPDDVQKLMIVDAFPFWGYAFNPEATAESIRPTGKQMQDEMLKASYAEFTFGAGKSSESLVTDPANRKLVTEMALTSDRAVFAEALYDDITTDVRPRLARLTTPTELLYPYDATLQGPNSAAVDKLYVTAYAGMPLIKMHRIDGSRHFIMYDQPVAFDAAVQAFLK
jgi:pimeloyl-ACP methyl ester carboxylesterase